MPERMGIDAHPQGRLQGVHPGLCFCQAGLVQVAQCQQVFAQGGFAQLPGFVRALAGGGLSGQGLLQCLPLGVCAACRLHRQPRLLLNGAQYVGGFGKVAKLGTAMYIGASNLRTWAHDIEGEAK